MTNHDILQRCRNDLRTYIVLTERRDALKATLLPRAIRLAFDRIQTSGERDYISETLAAVADLDGDLGQRIKRIVQAQQAAWRIIERLTDTRQQSVLELYYLTLIHEKRERHQVDRLYTWQDVADVLDISIQHAKRLHAEALQNLDG